MSPSYKHDRGSRELGLLITLLAEHLHIPMIGIGSTTLQRPDLKKAIEADEAFYFANQEKLHGIDELDLAQLPPPDLAIEVEISSRLGMRKSIYAALGVPEIWRYDGARLLVELLRADGSYAPSSTSPTFPSLPIESVPTLIQQGFATDRTTWLRNARQWIQDNVGR
ncbi:MAG: Uma2 family endonuclease [Phycisphaerae bacterium]|nr:Uma2 family endonuclease [Phycisphaerae bacterium]